MFWSTLAFHGIKDIYDETLALIGPAAVKLWNDLRPVWEATVESVS